MRCGDSYKIRKMMEMGDSDESICASMQRQYPDGEVQEFINSLKPKAKPKATKKAAVKSK